MHQLHIVGSTGFFGVHVLNRARASGLLVRGLARSHVDEGLSLDLARPREFDYQTVRAGDVVVFTAGISSPDACDREPELARRVNVDGTAEVIARFLDRDATVIFFSSDTVYGEAKRPVYEDAPLNPFGRYAEGKAEVESRFGSTPGFISLRMSYTFSAHDKFTRYLWARMQDGQVAVVFDTLFRCVVHIEDVVSVVLRIAGDNPSSFHGHVVNVGGPELLSRLEMAERFANAFPAFTFSVVEPPVDLLRRRPATINMRSRLMKELLGCEPIELRRAIDVEFGLGDRDTDPDG